VVSGIVATIQTVFLIAMPIAALGFALSWLLPEMELRRSVRSGAEMDSSPPGIPVGAGGTGAR
jgi:hypothetical protein